MANDNKKNLFSEPVHELANQAEDPFMGFLHKIISARYYLLANQQEDMTLIVT